MVLSMVSREVMEMLRGDEDGLEFLRGEMVVRFGEGCDGCDSMEKGLVVK